MSTPKFKVLKIETEISFESDSITRGTSLQAELNVTTKDIKKMFGGLPFGTKEKYSSSIVLRCHMESCIKGTEKNPSRGIYTIYTKFGSWRIGGGEVRFVEELKQQIESGNLQRSSL